MVAGETDPLEQAGLRFQIGLAEEALASDPADTEALRFLAHAYAALGRHLEGLAADRRLAALLPRDPRVRYNLACSCALAGLREEALERLEEAVRLGFLDVKLLRTDPDLDSLREEPRYRQIEARMTGRRGR